MISNRKLARIGELSFNNAIRLHKDSILLYKKGSFASAYFLSVLAVEELGKVHMIEKGLGCDDGLGDFDQEFLRILYDHSMKQGYFYNNAYFHSWFDGSAKHKAFVESVWKGALEKTKQNSVYVGLPKTRKLIDTKGRLSNPLKVDSKKTSKQITMVNDEILSLAFGHIYKIYGIDNPLVTQYFTRSFFNQIQKQWTLKSSKAKNHFRKVVAKFIKEVKPLKVT